MIQMLLCFINRSLLSLIILAVLLTAFPKDSNAYDLRDNAVLHAEKAQVLLERERYEEAIEELKTALRLNPYSSLSAALYNNLGLAYRGAKDYPLAFVSFQHAFRIQPTYALYYKNLIETYATAGQLSQVATLLSSSLKANPDNGEALFLLGLIYDELGNKEASKRYFSRFLKLEPESGLGPAARTYL